MILIQPNSLTPIGVPLHPTSMKITLNERSSTLSVQLISDDVLKIGTWLKSIRGPAAGTVWRIKSVDDTHLGGSTYTFQTEHMINSLKDLILFDEVTAGTMAGNSSATNCTAKKAFQYILGKQNIWTLGSFAYNVSKPYKFNGETLFAALETITSTLEDAYWDYNFSTFPFKLNVRKRSDEVDSEMRMNRNITGPVKVQIDKSNMYTVIYPVGKNDLHLSEKKLKKNTSVWGTIEHQETDQSYSTQDELRTWAQSKLNNHCEPTVTITVTGRYLAEATDEPLDRIRLNRVCRIPLAKYNTIIAERVTTLTWADWIKEPETFSVTLCNTRNDLSNIIKEISSSSSKSSKTSATNSGEDHAWMEDTTEHVGLVAEAIVGRGANGVDWRRVSEIIVDGEGIHQRVTRTEADITLAEARLDICEEAINAEVTARGEGDEELRSLIQVTATSITLSVASGQSSLYKSVIEVTSTQISLSVSSGQSSLYTSLIRVTSTQISLSVASGQSSLYTSVIAVTSTNISLSVSAGQSALYTSVIAVTSTSISLKVGKGEVISCINQTAESILIDASRISISGNTKINDVFTVLTNAVGVKVPMICSGNVDIDSNKVLNLYTATFQGGSPVTLTALELAGVIKSATVSGNTLTLTPFVGEAVTFSKAVSLSGAWSGRNYTVTAKINGTSVGTKTGIVYNGIVASGSVTYRTSGSNRYVDQDQIVYADDGEGNAGSQIMKKTVSINANAAYNAGLSGANVTLSRSAVTADSNYQKYLTYKASNNSNTSHNQTEKIYLVKATGKAQLRSGSASGTIIMEINTT